MKIVCDTKPCFETPSNSSIPAGQSTRLSTIPADNSVLEAAGAAAADVIVSGDHHLLELKERQGIRVMSPADFAAEVGSERP